MATPKNQSRYQQEQQKKAIKMVQELLNRLKKGDLQVVEQGWWQAGSPDRYTFRVTATTNNS